ncbi:MAG: helix-turn-helix domain-containing protein [Lysobacterales bacterium]|nr:helix-turn-helix domain-containing protein [Xanthomonadales bacterium]
MQYSPDGAKIRRWREERCWSQEHLAETASIGLRTVQRIEGGDKASRESLMALASAFGVDVMALTVDAKSEAARSSQQKQQKGAAALRLSFWIHLASYVFGMILFAGISLGMGGEHLVMRWPMIWWTVGVSGHALTVAIVELVGRFHRERGA